jgi:hypothetical protein
MSKNTNIEPEATHDPSADSDLMVTASGAVMTPAEVPAAEPDAPVTADVAARDGATYETSVQCPSCGTVWEGNDIRPHAEWFCDNCDYPLFWVLPGSSTEVAETGRSLSRLPGTDGRDALTSLACPHCGERNPPDPTRDCLRCGLPLTLPKPEQPEPVVITIEAPAPPPPPRRRIWPWVVTACVFATAFVVTLIVLITR